LNAFKKQILFACCSPVRSGVLFFGVFFGSQPGAKKPPFWGGFCTYFREVKKMVFSLILCGFWHKLNPFEKVLKNKLNFVPFMGRVV
jgi:hypothetical protein